LVQQFNLIQCRLVTPRTLRLEQEVTERVQSQFEFVGGEEFVKELDMLLAFIAGKQSAKRAKAM